MLCWGQNDVSLLLFVFYSLNWEPSNRMARLGSEAIKSNALNSDSPLAWYLHIWRATVWSCDPTQLWHVVWDLPSFVPVSKLRLMRWLYPVHIRLRPLKGPVLNGQFIQVLFYIKNVALVMSCRCSSLIQSRSTRSLTTCSTFGFDSEKQCLWKMYLCRRRLFPQHATWWHVSHIKL